MFGTMADSYNKGFQPPASLKLDGGNVEEAWKVWLQKFELFLLASRSDELPEKIQVAMFLSAIGDEGLHVFNTFKFEPDEDKHKMNVVKAKFSDYCSRRKNVVFERFQFWKCVQAPVESIDGFVTTLRLRAKTCEFGDQEESLIRDRVVLGCTDSRLQERLLREPDLSLTKALQVCRAAEATAEQLKLIRGDDSTAINALKSEKDFSSQKNDREYSSNRSICGKCGSRHPPRQCPAFGKICHSCKKENHFGKMCRASSRDYAISADQTKDVVFILERLGFFVERYQPPTTEVDPLIWKELIAHGYETLSPSTVYSISLMNLTSDKRPHINWNPRPSKGDMQVTWRYEFPNGLPHGLKNKMLTICQAVAYDRTYQYTWRDGVLFIMGEAAVCVEYETKRLDVSGRVNADSGGQESYSSSEYLWSHMSVFLIAVQRLVESWPGLFYKVSLIPQGLPLFGGDVVATEKSFCVYFAFDRSEKDENIRFTDGNVERILDLKLLFPFPMKDFSSVDEWLRYLHRNRELVFSVMSNPVSSNPVDQVLQSQQPSVTRHILTAKVTSKKIKWEIDGDTSAEGADEAEADDISNLFVRVALSATPFTKLQSTLDESGQQMTTPCPDETVDSVEQDEEEGRSTTEVNDEIVIRLSGFARAQNSTPPKVANGVLKQSTDERPNQSKEKLKPMLDQSTQTTRPLTDLLLSALTTNTSSDYINATITQMERDSCNHSIETKFCTIF